MEESIKKGKHPVVNEKVFKGGLQEKLLEALRKLLQDKKKQQATRATERAASSKPPPPPPPPPASVPPKAPLTLRPPKPSAPPPPYALPTGADFDYYRVYNPAQGWPYGLWFDRNDEYGAGKIWWLREARYNRWVPFEFKHQR